MADKRREEDPIEKVKSVARNMLDGFMDDLIKKKVLNKDELERLEDGVNIIVNRSGSLIEDLTEKTETVGKILMDRFFNTKKQLSIKSHSENESDESDESENSKSSSEESENKSEEENEELEDEEKAKSAEALAVPSTVPQAFQRNHKLKLCPPDDCYELKTTKAEEIYPVMDKEGRTRLALIIFNEKFDYLHNRDGSECDLSGMQDLLENLGYLVVVRKNLTALEMETELRDFAARPEHQSSDSTILVFMSHGILEGICGTKYRHNIPDVLYDDTIFQIFNNRNCENLRDKPKIIIMQACRGRGDGAVWVPDMAGASTCTYDYTFQRPFWSDAVKKTHVEKDFIAFKSSTPHNSSWRMDGNGSLFIAQIIYHFKEYSWCHHLEEIFRKVQRSFETPNVLTQMPTIERVSLTRYFYLFPGN
ncbi:caspase-12-like [Saccopteryx leptura]|uniref:caspase-12-like n=1 Tax=Saccopteryx leptura TaxID=249018 RepID=UPI00339C0140